MMRRTFSIWRRAAMVVALLALGDVLTAGSRVHAESRPRTMRPMPPEELSIEKSAQSPKEFERPRPVCAANQLPAAAAAICNFGTAALTISYWDGGAWRTVTVSSGQQTIIACDRCLNTIDVSFHNGRAARQVIVDFGKAYELYWAAAQSAWDLRLARSAIRVPIAPDPPRTAVK